MRYPVLVAFIVFSATAFGQRGLVFNDHIYDPSIRTVNLYPDGGGEQDYVYPAAVLFGSTNLVLEFDDLDGNRANYYAKLINCSWDWQKSNLMDLDYMREYNEYPINDYSFSGNTFQPYVHYKFTVPGPKLPGNYLLIVYRDDNSHLVISRRMTIYTTQVSLIQDRQQNGSNALSFTHQSLNFIVDYSKSEVLNPMENIHVVIRQNQRWDNALLDVRPTFLRDADSQLEYRFFDQSKSFKGGNEFRFVDFRSLNYPGQNTGSVNRAVKPYRLTVALDLPRVGQAYAQYNDMNGNYLIDNKDMGDGKTNANYVPVTFSLKTPQVSDPVYVIGAFNLWERTPENRMEYNSSTGSYEATVLLKQGLYNYEYYAESKSLGANYFEGDHFETENIYEVFVYNKAFRPDADLLIGYFQIPVNPR